ncbi:MAG TPA: N-methyl-L-tryptophan oxidase [Candidatus Acidoferrum sp.]|jgi:monomeric sarcosine oxidase|nr:N-methyl-L-tryptophan oxidase [Candidatus Acidoferrum sp.]
MSGQKIYDVAVVGAGVFGAWTAWHLAQRGRRVVLVEAYGPAHSRASSGGETRIIRMGYGADELYTRWSQRSLERWKELFAAARQPLFLETGVLWMAGSEDGRLRETAATLKRCGVVFEEYDRAALERRYPQIGFEAIKNGIFEPRSGVLLARRAVAAVVEDAARQGAEYRCAQILNPREAGRVEHITTSRGERIAARHFVFACGAWLGKVFPDVLGGRIFPSRQEVFFFGIPAGEMRFAPPALPTWLFQEDLVYGMPDIESRGLKIAFDEHGEHVDPDTLSRMVSPGMTEMVRKYVARRFPALRDAPLVETRVCQYENTSNGDFLIDRHPEMENVWFAGGGSGHGFKHGPEVGEYLAGQLLDGARREPRFSLETKATTQNREVF